MRFVHPLFLWALTCLAIPVIIHLFNFRRTKKVYFSNTRLLEVVREASSRKRRIKHLLVLFARLCFIAFLVLAFAQPFLPAAERMAGVKRVVIYTDNSLSMSVPMPDKARALDHAAAYVRTITGMFPRDTRFRFLTNDLDPGSSGYYSGEEINGKVTQLRLSPVVRTFEDIRRKLSADGGADVFFLSDFQRSTLGPIRLPDGDTLSRWKLVPVQPEQMANVHVDSAVFENPYMVPGEKNTLTVWLRNDSGESVDGVNVKLTIGNRLAATSSVSLPPSGTVPVHFDVSGTGRPMSFRVSVQDFPVTYDNEFFLSAMPLRPVRVVHVYEGKRQPYLQGVFGNRGLFRYEAFERNAVDFSRLDVADLLVIDNLATIDPALQRFAAQHRDARVIAIPPDKPSLESWRSIIGQSLEPAVSPTRAELAPPDFNDPFFEEVFEERSTTLRMPSATRVIGRGTDRTAFLKFRDGSPYLSRSGNVFWFSGPVSAPASDLSTHALFVPVMYRIAFSSLRDVVRPYYTLRDNLMVLPLDSVAGETPVRLAGPQEITPSQRQAGNDLILELPRMAVSAGHYAVLSGGDTLSVVALNAEPAESAMELLRAEALNEQVSGIPGMSVFAAGSQQAFSNEIKERYLGVPLWKYCLALALLFLAAEVLLLRFWKT